MGFAPTGERRLGTAHTLSGHSRSRIWAHRGVSFAQMVEIWTLSERHLVTELAVGFARRVNLILRASRDDNRIGQDYIFHGYASDFERGCDMLWRLGVAHADQIPGGRGCHSIISRRLFRRTSSCSLLPRLDADSQPGRRRPRLHCTSCCMHI